MKKNKKVVKAIIKCVVYGLLPLLISCLYPYIKPMIESISVTGIKEVFVPLLSITATATAILRFYYKVCADRIYEWVLDKWWYDLDLLEKRSKLPEQLKIFWVDDDYRAKSPYRTDLVFLKKQLSGTVDTDIVLPVKNEDLDKYNVLILDEKGVEQEGTVMDALNCASDLYKRNPYRLFIIYSNGRFAEGILGAFDALYIIKGADMINTVQREINDLFLNPKCFWEKKVLRYLKKQKSEDKINDKQINEIKNAYIKDWKNKSIGTKREDLLLYKLSKETKYQDLKLEKLCDYIML